MRTSRRTRSPWRHRPRPRPPPHVALRQREVAGLAQILRAGLVARRLRAQRAGRRHALHVGELRVARRDRGAGRRARIDVAARPDRVDVRERDVQLLAVGRVGEIGLQAPELGRLLGARRLEVVGRLLALALGNRAHRREADAGERGDRCDWCCCAHVTPMPQRQIRRSGAAPACPCRPPRADRTRGPRSAAGRCSRARSARAPDCRPGSTAGCAACA
jgi:hypothetical protein